MEKNKSKLNMRRIVVLIILLIICILILFTLVNFIKKIFSKEKVAGNLANTGLVFETKEAVYYNKYDKGIVKIKNGEEYQITDESASSITVIDDTIYYLTVSSSNTIELKSVKTNGDNLTNIKTLYTPLNKFYIENQNVYYINNKDKQGIASFSLESREEEMVVLSNVQDFVIDDGHIYFVDNAGYLYSVKNDGSDYKTITTDYSIKRIQILKNWIYFYNNKDNCLSKINKKGTKVKNISTFVNNEIYNITNKYIYYYDSIDKKICRSNLKGKKSKALASLSSEITKINIAKGIVYYIDDSKDETQIYQMYRIKRNGSATKSIDY